jgi:hypothetical protein
MIDDPNVGQVRPLTAREARERYISLVQMDGLGIRLNKLSEQYVYHYTNLAGLRGIVDSGALWASDYRYLNDRTEFAFGLDILEMCIAHPGSTPALPDPVRGELLDEIAMIKRGHASTYVLSASFCRKGNVLSQWRAYGRQDGVAIAFDRAHLTSCAGAQQFACDAVHYYWSDSVTHSFSSWLGCRCTALVSDLTKVKRVPETIGREDNPEVYHINTEARRGDLIRRWIAETAAFIKHPAFEEEVEWRCVLIADKHGAERPIRDRSAGSKVIPYIDLTLADPTDGFLGIGHVIVGPTRDPEAVRHAVSHIADRIPIRDSFGVFMPYHPLKA